MVICFYPFIPLLKTLLMGQVHTVNDSRAVNDNYRRVHVVVIHIFKMTTLYMYIFPLILFLYYEFYLTYKTMLICN